MSDNLKTWPETIYLNTWLELPDIVVSETPVFSDKTRDRSYWSHEKVEKGYNAEYIRADIVKARENELLAELRRTRSKMPYPEFQERLNRFNEFIKSTRSPK